ncbi:hypothetical protein BQ6471_00015 [Vibrio gazogenes]|nr:hypothetical protein BQ6471_00015 [Vibrio gazogenes]
MGRSQLSAIIQLIAVQPEIMPRNDMTAVLLDDGVCGDVNITIASFKPTRIVQAVTTVLLLIGSDQQMLTGIDGALIIHLTRQQAGITNSRYHSCIG